MRFSDIPGNEALKATLVKMVDEDRLPHALLLSEEDGCGAVALALALLQYLSCPDRKDGEACGRCPNCSKMVKMLHSDLHFIFPTNVPEGDKGAAKDITSERFYKEWRSLLEENPFFLEDELLQALSLDKKTWDINVAEAQSLIATLALSPVEDGWRMVLCYLPETLNVTAANKLLKLVEEPPRKTVFVFVTHHPEQILQTIYSRCQCLRVAPAGEPVLADWLRSRGLPEAEAAALSRVSRGSAGAALAAKTARAGEAEYGALAEELFAALFSGDRLALLSVGEALADMGSRNRQKAFLQYLSRVLREVFLRQRGLAELSRVSQDREGWYDGLTRGMNRNFSARMLPVLSRTLRLLERNVNQKILFCDLMNRISANYDKA